MGCTMIVDGSRVLTGDPFVGAAVPPLVPDGLCPGIEMYPNSPFGWFPHKSSGYPGHGTLQSLVKVVAPGT